MGSSMAETPPTTPGLGYSFTGQAIDAQHAAVASCDRSPVTIVLQPGGNVDIQILDRAGRPATSDYPAPPDNLYLPALGDQAALETAPVDQSGHQLVDQLAGGTLSIHGTTSNLRCSGPGVAADPAVGGATVTVVPGSTVQVTCQES